MPPRRARRVPGRGAVVSTAALGILWAVLLPAPTEAQQGADRNRMSRGDSVRVRMTGSQTVRASFDHWVDDGIVLTVQGFEDPYAVSLEHMERLDVYMMRTRRESFRNGAIMGAAAGLFIGAGVGLLLHKTGAIDDPEAPAAELVSDALQFMGLGIIGGTLVGGFYGGRHPGLGWIRIQLPAY